MTYSKAKVEQTTKDLIRDGIPPPDQPIDEVIEDAPTTFAEDSAESETTVKYDLTTYLGRFGKIQVGGGVKLFGIDYDAVAPYGDDSPYAPVPRLNPFALQQSYTSVTVPNGGEVWPCRVSGHTATRTIDWTSSDAGSGVATIELRYSADGGMTYPHHIAMLNGSALSYEWALPDDRFRP